MTDNPTTVYVGIDVGKNACVAVASSKPIANPADFFDYEAEFLTLRPDPESIQKILALKPPDGRLTIFMEPTGSYSYVFVESFRQCQGVEVQLIDHNRVNSARSALCGWDDKDDWHDAVVLLVLCFEHLAHPERVPVIRQRDPVIQKLNKLYLDSESCNKVLNGLINRARQKLHTECPELSDIKSKPSESGGIAPMWGFVAGREINKRALTRYQRLVAGTIGSASRSGFSGQLKSYASSICDWQLRRHTIDLEMRALLDDKRFIPYLKIFNQFGAGLDTKVIWLLQIFPFEQFLGDDKMPIVKVKRNGTRSGRPTKARKSLRKFHSAMGMAPNQRSSGMKHGEHISGSGLCRIALWRLVETRIEPDNPSTLRNSIGKILRNQLLLDKTQRGNLMLMLEEILADKKTGKQTVEAMKAALMDSGHRMGATIAQNLEKMVFSRIKSQVSGALVRLARSRCAARLVKLLFKELCRVFCYGAEVEEEKVATDANGVPYRLSGVALAQRVGRSTTWLISQKKKHGSNFPTVFRDRDPLGYAWNWHERHKFYYAIAPGATDDGGMQALVGYFD